MKINSIVQGMTGQEAATIIYNNSDVVLSTLGINIIGVAGVMRNGDAITLIVPDGNKLSVFDVKGGYRFIAPGTYTIGHSQVLLLSESSDTYKEVAYTTKGTGEVIYPRIIPYNQLTGGEGIIAFNWTDWQTPFNALQIRKGVFKFQCTDTQIVTGVTASKITVQPKGHVLNLYNGSFITLDTAPLSIANSANSVIVVSKEKDNLTPLLLTDVWGGTGYLYEVTQWSDIKTQNIPYVIIGTAEGNKLLSMSEGVRIRNNSFMAVSQNEDINGIRSLFYTETTRFNLYLDRARITIQELVLDSITMDYPATTGAKVVFGAWSNPQNTANKGTYRQVAVAKMMTSPNNLNYIDWYITPLNNSGVFGYLQTTRAFFNYFYKVNNPNDWATADGTDVFVNLNLDGLYILNGESSAITDRENEGILPRLTFNESPLPIDLVNKLRRKQKDVTVLVIGDSISTNGNYASVSSDAAYRPPRMDEEYYVKLLEDDLRWRGQEYRRYDAMAGPSGDTPAFTETADTKETKEYDTAWDWQYENPASNFYRLPTRILSGTNVSVSFKIPKGIKQAAFIYRTDYLCAASTVVSVNRGNGICKIKLNSGNVEANGYSFSTQEADEIITTSNGNLRKSQGQKRLMFRFDDLSAETTVTITNVGSGRLNYWGIEYTPYEFMLRVINVSRGGHNISRLRDFESWDVDGFSPDAILMQCMVINEGAMSVQASSSTNTPAAFSQRFKTYIDDLKAKEYSPEIIPYALYIGVQANIVDQVTGKYQMSFIAGGEPVDTYKYIGVLDQTLRADLGYFVNLFNKFDEIAYRKAQIDGTNNIWLSAITASSKMGDTFTVDSVHLNDYGSLIAYRLLHQYINY